MTEKTDWKQVLAEIVACDGMTQMKIADIVGCGQATISDLAFGTTKEPRHSLGESIRALHQKVLAKAA